jgi:hypothetical protein
MNTQAVPPRVLNVDLIAPVAVGAGDEDEGGAGFFEGWGEPEAAVGGGVVGGWGGRGGVVEGLGAGGMEEQESEECSDHVGVRVHVGASKWDGFAEPQA